MLKLKWMLLSTLLILSACQTSTPIAVATKQWVVPAVDPQQRAKEQQALSMSMQSLQDWNTFLSSLPTAPAPLPPR